MANAIETRSITEPTDMLSKRRHWVAGAVLTIALGVAIAKDNNGQDTTETTILQTPDAQSGLITVDNPLAEDSRITKVEDPIEKEKKLKEYLDSVTEYLRSLDNQFARNSLLSIDNWRKSGSLEISYQKPSTSKSEQPLDAVDLISGDKNTILFDLNKIEKEKIPTEELAIKFLVLSSVGIQQTGLSEDKRAFFENIYWQVVARAVINPAKDSGKITSPRLIELTEGELYTDVYSWLGYRSEDSIIHGLSQE